MSEISKDKWDEFESVHWKYLILKEDEMDILERQEGLIRGRLMDIRLSHSIFDERTRCFYIRANYEIYNLILYLLKENKGERGLKTYIAQAGNAIKIGITNNLTSRMKQLQTDNPYEIKVLFLIFRDCETDLQNLVRKYNIRGEWFSMECLLPIEEYLEKTKVPFKRTM